MDWLVDRNRPGAVQQVVNDIGAFLRRHGRVRGTGADVEAAISDALSRACACGGPRVHVELDWGASVPLLTVVPVADGISEHRQGCDRRVSVQLPAERSAARIFTIGQRTPNALPAAEFDADGWLPREPFLKALLVLMTQTVDDDAGPEMIDQAIAAAGVGIGSRMENAFRRARGVVERLSPGQMGELFVGLKAAIGGDFYVIEVTEDRVVLGNRRCPFGDAVRHSPSLCRMTSSVFGGIAARNAGHSAVTLDARIAVGDPECRVVVDLAPGEHPPDAAHLYGPPTPLRTLLIASPLLADLLAEPLAHDHIDVVATAAPDALWTGDALQQLLDQIQPHLMVIQAPDDHQAAAIDVATAARDAQPELPVAVLCREVDPLSAKRLLDMGNAVGYLVEGKTRDAEALIAAQRAVAAGGIVLSPVVQAMGAGRASPLDALTSRELTVLSLVAVGLANASIAERIVVSRRAVEKHLNNIFRKLGITKDDRDRRVQATLIYRDWHSR